MLYEKESSAHPVQTLRGEMKAKAAETDEDGEGSGRVRRAMERLERVYRGCCEALRVL